MGFVGSYLARVMTFRTILTDFRAWVGLGEIVPGEEGNMVPFKRSVRGCRMLVGRGAKAKAS